ncbi:unnamed protein product [Ectocarpus sp. CCAP 1310/34]|nr:unnamed protein product [Ectocarpus sp. CCAP 1310/34]
MSGPALLTVSLLLLRKWVDKSVMELSSSEESESEASENLSCTSEDESGDDAEP